jgi:hypothetical protein
MKAACLLLAMVWLCSCKTQPKTITVAFNGSRGRDFLNQGCAVLQRDYDRVRQLPAKEQAALFAYSDKAHIPCLNPAEGMYLQLENRLLSAFAVNPECHGIQFFQGYYGPKDSTLEAMRQFTDSDWRLSLDLNPSSDTGEIALANSQWTLNPREFKTIWGSLDDVEKATTQICIAIKSKGGQI